MTKVGRAFALLGIVQAATASSALCAPAAASGDSFEALVANASGTVDLPTLVHPFVDDCKEGRRELDRARCRSTASYLKRTLHERAFVAVVTDPDVVSLSAYDARVKGFRLTLAGCLACKEPVVAGGGAGRGDQRFVTLVEPTAGGESLMESVEIARASVAFDGVAQSQAWLKDVKPHLRAEFVFAPADKPWTVGPSRGFAFKLLGARVFNHCTGEVVYSKPPSSGPAEKFQEARECDAGDAQPVARDASGLAPQLSAQAINQGVAPAREAMEACLAKAGTKATAMVAFVVPGATGVPTSVTIQGPLGGTEAGLCVLEAARTVTFPRFARESQRFTYPVRLRR